MIDDIIWQTKLHARLHDPAEKALVLLRDPEGHEGGTSRDLHEVLFQGGMPEGVERTVKRADWWAAAADRPQWPKEVWARVLWTKQPILIHPLTGRPFDLKSLADTDIEDTKQRSFDHFARLTVKQGGSVDWKRTLLGYWRFGPELVEDENDGKLGMLWPLLPADTRVPDHSIWDHLDLTSAFAGAFAADPHGEAALLVMSLGPVQSFIAAARSTSDLWAGSHLLSRLSWEAMKVICERFGPDAILFPRLRAVPLVDLWLRDEMKLPKELFESADWQTRATDANPLFAAALPNRFVALVPASQVGEIAAAVANGVRDWLQQLGSRVVTHLLKVAGQPDDDKVYAHDQMRRQLEGFPEVHWAAVSFALIQLRNPERQTDLDVSALLGAMAPFFGAQPGEDCGFLASAAWKILQKKISWNDATTFFNPNPGVLYPAIYELSERALAAAKSAHAFAQVKQHGWRDSLTGESEWITDCKRDLGLPPGGRTNTLWTQVAAEKPAWARKGEHLGALSAIKRLWPTLFGEQVRGVLAVETVPRFVVSTHTMALAHQLDGLLQRELALSDDLRSELKGVDLVALPRRLMRHSGHPEFAEVKRIPALLEQARDDEKNGRRIEQLIQTALALDPENGEGTKPETYYALLMMDGDDMGAWLSGSKEEDSASYRECFHPAVKAGFDRGAARHELLRAYGQQPRAMSPNRHLAISAALNDFALHVVPEVIENEYLGRVIYAGGDDVLAMLPVSDLIPAMQRLRWAYSGHGPSSDELDWRQATRSKRLEFRNGFGLLPGRQFRLLRLMGEKATASCGAVIAHYQAPLSAVLRELRAAEQRAKSEGGKNAWSLALIKRSGGAVHLTAKWGEPLDVFAKLHRFLANPDVSRRAVYNTLEWLKDLPPQRELLGTLLGYQFKRQAADDSARSRAPDLAHRVVNVAFNAEQRPSKAEPLDWLQTFLTGAEFLAREVRSDLAVQTERIEGLVQ